LSVANQLEGSKTSPENIDNLEVASFSVLPELPRHLLSQILLRLTVSEKQLALRNKILPVAWLPNLTLFAAVEGQPQQQAVELGLRPVARIAAKNYRAGVFRVLGPEVIKHATDNLKLNQPEFSAHHRTTAAQVICFGLLASVYFLGMALLPTDLGFAVTSLILSVFFLNVVTLRFMCVLHTQVKPAQMIAKLSDVELPVYSILIPLFRETGIVEQLVAAIAQLDYPTSLLDVKIILEESDIAMHRKIAGLDLPSHFDVIVVPAGKPQTKPKALNYALQFARGELLTIYDAEDIPEPDQLRKAAAAFAAGPENLACLQAELTFYNSNENWLARQFTVEYAILFGLVLPGLAREFLPLPLGGTSNHFRTHILRKVGAWDPYNVTEDADLGLRLARRQYLTRILNSKTFEEANTELGNWISQRARWFKGFLQTWLVHMRNPSDLPKEIGWDGVWAMQITTLGIIFSSAVHPAFTFAICYQIWQQWGNPPTQSTFALLVAGTSLAVTLLGYGVSFYAGYVVSKRRHMLQWSVLLTMPLYWLLMGVAAWVAIWQFIVAPFHWNKTKHGLSSFTTATKPYLAPVTVIAAGPKIITKMTGKKNKIIGTVSFGGKAAAFFSASAMRSLRFSWARTRKAEPKGVP